MQTAFAVLVRRPTRMWILLLLLFLWTAFFAVLRLMPPLTLVLVRSGTKGERLYTEQQQVVHEVVRGMQEVR